MKIRKNIVAISASLLSLTAFATPVEFDTPNAHVIVIRSIESWSGDSSASEKSLNSISKHEGGFQLESKKGTVLGYPLLFGGLNEDSVVQGVNTELKKLNYNLTQTGDFTFKVDKPVAIDPTKYSSFANSQRDLYKLVVISEGNPASLSGRVGVKKFFSGVLSFGLIVLGGEKYGAIGSQTVLNTGVAGDAYQLSASMRSALIPIHLPDIDVSSYKSIDVRNVIQGNNDRFGQVIIAYKNDKTDETENAALIKAIVTLTGADTTVDAIKQARNDDLTNRQAIWDACVAEGKCKKD